MAAKGYISIFFLLFLFKDDLPAPKIKFEYIVHNRGDIYEDDEGRFFFPFQNIGTAPLLVSDVRSSCGCLVPFHRKEPIAPGANDTVFAKYDTKRLGPFNKTLTIRTNELEANVITILRVSGRVLSLPIDELEVQSSDSLRIQFNEYNKAEISASGQSEFALYFTNLSEDILTVHVSSPDKGLFYCKEKELSIAPRETKTVLIFKNANATNWYGTLTFELSSGKKFKIDVLK